MIVFTSLSQTWSFPPFPSNEINNEPLSPPPVSRPSDALVFHDGQLGQILVGNLEAHAGADVLVVLIALLEVLHVGSQVGVDDAEAGIVEDEPDGDATLVALQEDGQKEEQKGSVGWRATKRQPGDPDAGGPPPAHHLAHDPGANRLCRHVFDGVDLLLPGEDQQHHANQAHQLHLQHWRS